MVNKSRHDRREGTVLGSIFAAVPMSPLLGGLRSSSHRRLKDLGPADSSDEEEAGATPSTTSQSSYEESANELSVRRMQNEEIAKIQRKNALASLEKDEQGGSVRERRSKSLHSRSSVEGDSQRTRRISNSRKSLKFNDMVEYFLDELKQEYEEQERQAERPRSSKHVLVLRGQEEISSSTFSDFEEEEFSECADWGERGDPPARPPPHPTETPPVTPVQVIRKSSRSQRGDGISPQSIASPITPRGHRTLRVSRRRSVDHQSSPLESPNNTSRSRNLSNHQRSSPHQLKTPVSRNQQQEGGMPRTPPTSRTKSPSSRSQRSQRTLTSSRTKSPSTRHQRSRSQQAQHTPTSRTKSPSTSTSTSSQRGSQRAQHQQTPTSSTSRAKSPSGRSTRGARPPMSPAKSPSKHRRGSSNHQRTSIIPPPPPLTPPPIDALHNSLDRKVFSPTRSHRKLMTDEIKQLHSERSDHDSVSSAGPTMTTPTSPILEEVRKWNQKHVPENRPTSKSLSGRRSSSRKVRESFSSHSRTASLKDLSSESKTDSNYLIQAKNRHEARRHSRNTEGFEALKAMNESCYF
jgi:hypothetical protein